MKRKHLYTYTYICIYIYIYIYIDSRNFLPYRCASENMSAERINFHQIRFTWRYKIIAVKKSRRLGKRERERETQNMCVVCLDLLRLRLFWELRNRKGHLSKKTIIPQFRKEFHFSHTRTRREDSKLRERGMPVRRLCFFNNEARDAWIRRLDILRDRFLPQSKPEKMRKKLRNVQLTRSINWSMYSNILSPLGLLTVTFFQVTVMY